MPSHHTCLLATGMLATLYQTALGVGEPKLVALANFRGVNPPTMKSHTTHVMFLDANCAEIHLTSSKASGTASAHCCLARHSNPDPGLQEGATRTLPLAAAASCGRVHSSMSHTTMLLPCGDLPRPSMQPSLPGHSPHHRSFTLRNPAVSVLGLTDSYMPSLRGRHQAPCLR